MDLISRLKKGLLVLSIPLTFGCSSSKYLAKDYSLVYDDMYPKSRQTIVQAKNETLDTLTKSSVFTSRNINPEYVNQSLHKNNSQISNNIYFNNNWNNMSSNYVVIDNDFDGINNLNDPWPYRYGPFVDMNFNGRIDFSDMQVAGFSNYYSYNMYSYGFYPSSYFGLGSYYSYGGYYGNNYWNYYNYYPSTVYIKSEKNVVYGKRPDRTSTNINLNHNRSNLLSNQSTNTGKIPRNSGRKYTPIDNSQNNRNNGFDNERNTNGNKTRFDNQRNYSPNLNIPTQKRTFTPSIPLNRGSTNQPRKRN